MEINIKPRFCDHCDKPEEELKPFGGPGDPCNGDFTGLKLVNTYALLYEGPKIEEYEIILDEFVNEQEPGDIWRDNIKELEEKYGVDKVEQAFLYDQLRCTLEKVMLCRDCIIK